jgi:Replication initiation factor
MQATVREDPQEVFDLLAGTLGGSLETARGLNGYRESRIVKRRDETLARVLFGGSNGWPHVIASGWATDDVVPVIRAAWPDWHEVTRMDSAQDFDEAGAYNRMSALLEQLAASQGITITRMESTRDGIRSRTTYLGAPSSRVRVRLYEKGLFERQEGRSEAPEHWVRLELQVRPTGSAARQQAARLDPAGAWGQSRWSRQLAHDVLGIDVPPVTMQPRREPDYARAIKFLRRQYGPTLIRALEVEGSLEALGRLLGLVAAEEGARGE